LSSLSHFLKNKGLDKAFICIGSKSAELSGALKEISKTLPSSKQVIFSGIEPNPTIESLKEGIRLCRRQKADLIVAVGGGSVIDYGKSISVLANAEDDIRDIFYKKKALTTKKVTFIAIPTTFGTSSEITPYAVMTDDKQLTKVTLQHKLVFPDAAFINPKFTLSMPKWLVAASCADLFSHAMEAYWSVRATEITDIFAIEAIKLFLQYYSDTFKRPHNLKARERISLASIYAGLAFSNTRTTACHAISYPLTTVFKIPHGIACILSLSKIFEFNSIFIKEKSKRLCGYMGCRGIKAVTNKISLILKSLNIKSRLRDYGLDKKDIKVIQEKAYDSDRLANNPRKINKEDLEKILEVIY
jgi:alcohol dehydrogenase class IV